MDGTGIGTFNDRLRDAVRGGGPFDGDHRVNQGFASGLYTDPNGVSTMTPEQQRQRLLLLQDQIKVGLTGNLQDFEFVDRTGATVTGAEVDYNGSPAGYTSDPQEAITYVEAHDNETLFDALAYKLPQDTSTERPAPSAGRRPEHRRPRPGPAVLPRRQRAAAVQVARPEQLRLRRLVQPDLLEQDGQQLRRRPAARGRQRIGVADHRADPGQHLDRSGRRPTSSGRTYRFDDLLRIRRSSPLFRLGTAAAIQQRLSFANGGPDQIPGLIVMRISDTVGADLDRNAKSMVDHLQRERHRSVDQPGRHREGPVQAPQGPADLGRRRRPASKFTQKTGTFFVPALTTAVFVEHQPGPPDSRAVTRFVPLVRWVATAAHRTRPHLRSQYRPGPSTHPVSGSQAV